jgi:hypothetical protein
MKFSLLLFILYQKLKSAARKNKAFQSYIKTMEARILIKTADGKRGRLFVFDRGRVSSLRGEHHGFNAALVWSDPSTAFRVMASGSDDESFKAAAGGKMKIEGQAFFIQWFTDGVKLIM